jgi:hypothetical protein
MPDAAAAPAALLLDGSAGESVSFEGAAAAAAAAAEAEAEADGDVFGTSRTPANASPNSISYHITSQRSAQPSLRRFAELTLTNAPLSTTNWTVVGLLDGDLRSRAHRL